MNCYIVYLGKMYTKENKIRQRKSAIIRLYFTTTILLVITELRVVS